MYKDKYQKYKNKYLNLKGGAMFYAWKVVKTFGGEIKYNNMINDFITKAYTIYLSDNSYNEICFRYENESHKINFNNMEVVRQDSIFKEKLEIIASFNVPHQYINNPQ